MSNETDLDELSILKHGYERFLSSPGDLGNCENAIITVRRQQQITTHFGPLTTKNKIKVSLSQEQILNRSNRYPVNIKRSQSTNIQKTLFAPNGLVGMNYAATIRPSLIPVKIKEQAKLRAVAQSSNQRSLDLSKDAPKYRPIRKMSAPFEKRNYVSQEESTLSSLPLPMTYSLEPVSNHRIDFLDKFKCRICMNIFNDPRVLNCLHTFCLKCLYSIEYSSQSKTNPNKLNPNQYSNSIEHKEMSSSSDESKKSDRRMSKTGTSLIRRSFSTQKRPDEQKQQQQQQQQQKSLTMQKRLLSSITEKSKITLKCPICEIQMEISIGGVSRVPKNFLLERQLQDEIRKLQTFSLNDEYCSQCYDEIKAVAYCLNCELNLCNICKEAHICQRLTSKHALIVLSELKTNKLGTNQSIKCFIHPTQDLKLYCINCNQVACHNCTIILHKGHTFESIDKAKQHIIKKFNEAVEQNQRFQEYINESVSKLNDSILKINNKAEIVEMEIEIFLKNYFVALDAHKESLLHQVVTAKELKSSSVMKQQEYLAKRANELQQANQFAKNLLENGNDIEILTFIGLLRNRFDFCQKAKIPVEPKFSNYFQFLRDVRAPITSQQHNIPIYGVLSIQDNDSN